MSFKTPTKKARKTTNYDLCLKCQKPDKLSIAQPQSILKFCESAEVNKDDVYNRIKHDIDKLKRNEKAVLWHAECYKQYTHKRNQPSKRGHSETQTDRLDSGEQATKKHDTLGLKKNLRGNYAAFVKTSITNE